VYEYSHVRGLGSDPDQRIVALQQAAIENGCQLPGHGADGVWGLETAQATECLAAQRGWLYVVESWPWVPNRPVEPQPVRQSPMFTFHEQGGPGEQDFWLSWVSAMVSLVAIIAIGSYVTGRLEKRRTG
jgi:hypothetical protein